MRRNFMRRLPALSFMLLIVSIISLQMNVRTVKAGEKKQKKVTIPAHAVEIIPGELFWLGTAKKAGILVEGYAIIHHKAGFAKPTGCNEDGSCQGWEDPGCIDCQGGSGEPAPNENTCYSFISAGVKWNNPEPFIVDPTNDVGLIEDQILNELESAIGEWEIAADFDILGNGTINKSAVNGADLVEPDDQNEVLFADVDSPGAIAVTIVWGIFRGPPPARALVEWDQVYDDVDFDWSFYVEDGKMNFLNVATHELGHSVGLADLYDNLCSEATMYGYAAPGETKKTTLEAGDINGVFTLYK